MPRGSSGCETKARYLLTCSPSYRSTGMGRKHCTCSHLIPHRPNSRPTGRPDKMTRGNLSRSLRNRSLQPCTCSGCPKRLGCRHGKGLYTAPSTPPKKDWWFTATLIADVKDDAGVAGNIYCAMRTSPSQLHSSIESQNQLGRGYCSLRIQTD